MKDFLFPVIIVLVLSSLVVFLYEERPGVSNIAFSNQVKKFSSYDELKNFLQTNTGSYYGYGGVLTNTQIGTAVPEVAPAKATGTETARSEDYSTTNIQVAGVDEADFVKNDGKYIYAVSGDKVVIIDAYPAENAKIVSEIELNGTPSNIFVNKDKLIVFGTESVYGGPLYESAVKCLGCGGYSSDTFIRVYDISDRANPVLTRNVTMNGYYFDSRMIGDYVYAVLNEPVYYYETQPVPLPVITSNNKAIAVPASEIYYFDIPDYSYTYTNVLAINTQNDGEEVSSKTFLMGYSQTMYVSVNNIYVTYTKRLTEIDFYDRIIDEIILPAVPQDVKSQIKDIQNSDINKYEKMTQIGKVFQNYIESLNPEESAKLMKSMEEKMLNLQKDIAKEMEKTVIHKISINNGAIEYKTNGEVPGYTLNQFSMDEYNGYLRIATTTGNWGNEQLNHVYVLDDNMKIVGKLEDLAQGERIYSARFLGDKGYMVTFRQIDPLFVIDLSDPTNPKVLGYLKLPGVSDYLHPYDETHVIGVGQDATDEGRIKGMKLSLFDVSNVSNPVEVSKYIIGERGTYSEALNDHKAFMFSKSKNLLVIPVSLSENNQWNVFQGAYVFNLDLNNGFVLKGKITHANETVNKTEYYYDYSTQITRSLYMDDVLYTVSNKMIKMNSLDNLDEINKIQLPYEEQIYPLYSGVE
jgi:uncharacterized secreted protein with C-terminal beta-propeller domain